MTEQWEIVPQTMAVCLSRFSSIAATHSRTTGAGLPTSRSAKNSALTRGCYRNSPAKARSGDGCALLCNSSVPGVEPLASRVLF
jgi:hypothetical protein